MKNGTGKRRRIGQDEVVMRKVELERITCALDLVAKYLQTRVDHDEAADELLQRVEFTSFGILRKLATSSSSDASENMGAA